MLPLYSAPVTRTASVNPASPASRSADTRPFPIRGTLLRTSLRYTMLAWLPGAFWMGATGNTAMTPLGQYLGANDLIFALITQAAPMLSVLFMIPGSMIVERLGRRKTFFLWTVTPHRGLYILIGLLPWILPPAYSTAIFLTLLVFVSMGLNSFGGQAWVNWMADLVPPRIRGVYFARRSRMGVAVIAAATVLVGVILDWADDARVAGFLRPLTDRCHLPPSHDISTALIVILSAVFMLAGAIGMIDILLFTKVAEPPMKQAPPEPLRERLLRPLRDVQFRRYVTYYSVWSVANSWCSWFWMLYLLDFLQAQHKSAANAGTTPWWGHSMYLTAAVILPVSFQIGQFLGYPMWGRAVDRFGRKPVFLVSSALHTLTWVSWIFLSEATLPWMPLVQIAGGFIGGGMDIASFNMMLLFNRKGGAGYQAVGSVIFSTAAAVAACAAGAVATALGGWGWTFAAGTSWAHTFNRYTLLILVGVAIKYVADLVFLRRVQDLDAKPAGHALRFVVDNCHGTLETLIFMPLRSGVEATGSGIKRLWK